MELASVVPASLASPIHLAPFRALRLNPVRIADPATLRAIATPQPDLSNRLAAWRAAGLAALDDSPGYHLHEYTAGGLTVRGLVGALDLTSRAQAAPPQRRGVVPHERIHPEQADELAARMAAVQINPAPILLACRARPAYRTLLDSITAASAPEVFTDRAGQRHRIWRVTDGASMGALNHEVERLTCMVADGHHRYAAYLALQRRNPDTGWDQGLAMLVDQLDTPFFLGPIHRTLVGVALEDVCRAAEAAGAHLSVGTRQEAVDALPDQRLVVTDGQQWVRVAPRSHEGLLVNWLHAAVLPRLREGHTVRHHHSFEEAIAATRAGAVAIVLPAPTYETVAEYVTSGHLLPEKATSFQPKPTVGVIMRPILDAP